MRPNIFDFATSELSQDAFFAWLMSWADDEFDEDPQLKECAKNFITHCLRMEFEDFSEPIHRVVVKKQYNHIDLLIVVNGKYGIVIEDKTNSSIHGTQMEDYRNFMKNEQQETENVVFIYLKTGNESQSVAREVRKSGYHPIYRKDVLMFLNPCSSNNEIFRSFLSKLNEIEDESNEYLTKPVSDWNWAQIQAFYMELENRLRINEWSYRANPRGGEYVCNWNWVETNDCGVYLEFVDCRLCIKIGNLADGLDRSGTRDKYHNILMDMAKERSLPLSKPRKFACGEYMTVANVELTDLFSADFDLEEICSKLKEYEQLVKDCADCVNAEIS